VAGVAAHYSGHLRAPTREKKAELYERTIKYLTRARPKFDLEPRLYVYLGVSNFRLGHQKEAEELIEHAIPLATNDPDVYYCRAEIFQRVNTKRSIEDIERYLKMIDTLHAQGVPINDAKQARVKRMLDILGAISRGEQKAAEADELFDPLPEATSMSAPAPVPARLFTDPKHFALAALAAAALAAGAWRLVGRRKRG
jgi:tetratricopeptide (TPR) repeat protein